MAPFLLDSNVLIALAWPEHQFHDRVGRWFARHSRAGWATCPFTQAAFIRILSNPAFSANALTPVNALQVLESNLQLPSHHFWPDAISLGEAAEIQERTTHGAQPNHRCLSGQSCGSSSRKAGDAGQGNWCLGKPKGRSKSLTDRDGFVTTLHNTCYRTLNMGAIQTEGSTCRSCVLQ